MQMLAAMCTRESNYSRTDFYRNRTSGLDTVSSLACWLECTSKIVQGSLELGLRELNPLLWACPAQAPLGSLHNVARAARVPDEAGMGQLHGDAVDTLPLFNHERSL